MIIDTDVFRAITTERDQLRSEAVEAGEIRGHVASIAEAVLSFGDAVSTRWAPVATGVPRGGQPRHARPRGTHLRLVSGGPS